MCFLYIRYEPLEKGRGTRETGRRRLNGCSTSGDGGPFSSGMPRCRPSADSQSPRTLAWEDLNAGHRRVSQPVIYAGLEFRIIVSTVPRFHSIIFRALDVKYWWRTITKTTTMDGAHSPVTITATTKKSMSRSFLIDSLIGGVKHPVTVAAAAMPYHPQFNEYIQFLNRTAVAYGYRSPAPVVFPSAATIAGPRFFDYSAAGSSGFNKQHIKQRSPTIVKPVPVVATAGTTGHRNKSNHVKIPSKKRTADQMTTYDPGKSELLLYNVRLICTTVLKTNLYSVT